jgi:hypothetical protein
VNQKNLLIISSLSLRLIACQVQLDAVSFQRKDLRPYIRGESRHALKHHENQENHTTQTQHESSLLKKFYQYYKFANYFSQIKFSRGENERKPDMIGRQAQHADEQISAFDIRVLKKTYQYIGPTIVFCPPPSPLLEAVAHLTHKP